MRIEEITKLLFHAHHPLGVKELSGVLPEDLLKLGRHEDLRLRGRAIDALVSRGEIRVIEPLSADLRDSNLPNAFRAAQANRLGRLGFSAAEPILIETLSQTKDTLIRIKAVGALARIGTKLALDTLKTVAEDTILARVAEFAHMVVSHRLGLRPLRLPLEGSPPRVSLTGPAFSIVSRPMPLTSAVQIANSLGGDLYGMDPRIGSAIELTCPRGRLLLMMDGRSATASFARLISDRYLILGILLTHFAEDDTWATSRLILAGPSDSQTAYIAVFRQDGVLVHAGIANVIDDTVTAEIGSVEAKGNFALSVRAYAHGPTLSVSGFSASGKIAGSRPRAIAGPPLRGT